MIWLDTSQSPPQMKRYDGENWIRMDVITLLEMSGDLDDIIDGSTYGKVLLTQLSAGKVLLAQVEGDLDDVADGEEHGKVLLTSISAGKILLSQCLGNLDNILDGGTWGKIKLTDISSGHIKLVTCIGDLDDVSDGDIWGRVDITDISSGHILIGKTINSDGYAKMPDDWRKTEDLTLIDGGKIYTQTVNTQQLVAGSVTTAILTALWITGKKFRTSGRPSGAGIEFDDTEIVGFSDATTKQFYLRASDGKAVAGGGNVILDSSGVHIVGSQTLRFEQSGGTMRGVVGAFLGGDSKWYLIVGSPGSPDSDPDYVDIRAGEKIFMRGAPVYFFYPVEHLVLENRTDDIGCVETGRLWIRSDL